MKPIKKILDGEIVVFNYILCWVFLWNYVYVGSGEYCIIALLKGIHNGRKTFDML